LKIFSKLPLQTALGFCACFDYISLKLEPAAQTWLM